MSAKLKLKRLSKQIIKKPERETESSTPIPAEDDKSAQLPAEPVEKTPIQETVNTSLPTETNPVQASAQEGGTPPSSHMSSLPDFTVTPMDTEVPLEKRNNQIYVFGIIVTAIVLIVTGVVLYLKITQPVSAPQVVTPQVEEKAEMEIKITPVIAATSEAKLTLEVLNGSGVAGAAGKIAQTFINLGYTVVSTGNADSQTGNSLFINQQQKTRSTDSLIRDLSSLKISSVSGYFTDSTASARIIIGKE